MSMTYSACKYSIEYRNRREPAPSAHTHVRVGLSNPQHAPIIKNEPTRERVSMLPAQVYGRELPCFTYMKSDPMLN